jgi:enterochelin esterase-like enzyme
VQGLGDEPAVSFLRSRWTREHALAIAAGLCVAGVGAFGLYRYVDNFRLYRGFPPPREPSFVRQRGHLQVLRVASRALGRRRQRVLVYLPPGYAARGPRHYPVLYLLHGTPGSPDQFLNIVRAGIVEDSLVASGRARPLIVVMPFGSTGTFTDKEWVNGVRPHEGWETFVARDVVRAVDTRFATVPIGSRRAIAGLSEGGYGAINIALHHPGEFGLVESWSGYERASPRRSLFGRGTALVKYNSPLDELPRVASALRRAGTFFWFYCGAKDPLRKQNVDFASALARAQIRHRFFVVLGRHDWRAWRGNAAASILAVEHLLYRRRAR